MLMVNIQECTRELAEIEAREMKDPTGITRSIGRDKRRRKVLENQRARHQENYWRERNGFASLEREEALRALLDEHA